MSSPFIYLIRKIFSSSNLYNFFTKCYDFYRVQLSQTSLSQKLADNFFYVLRYILYFVILWLVYVDSTY